MGAVTKNPVRTHTYVLKPNYNPITFGAKTNIDVSSGDGVYGGIAASWTVTNHGSIQGSPFGVDLVSSGSKLTNTGTIAGTGTNGVGVDLRAGGRVNNQNGGKITGANTGLYATGAPATVINSGSITGQSGTGVRLAAGGSVSNQVGGVISGHNGVGLGAYGTVVNAGRISGSGNSESAVSLFHGGTVTNSGTISASGSYMSTVYLQNGGTVANSGTIQATGSGPPSASGIYLKNGGTVNNFAGGKISNGNGDGVFAVGAASTNVMNAGRIAGTINGVYLGAGGTVTNDAGAKITAESIAVYISGGSGRVTNAGTIQSYGVHSGIRFNAGGSVSNTGTISGGLDGVYVEGGTGTVTNSGAIMGTTLDGAKLLGGGTVTNQSGGTISGSDFGVYIAGGAGSVTNAGTISGGTASVEFAGSGANTLTLETGSSLTGNVLGSTASGATNALVLEGAGTADNSFDNFNTLTVKAGGDWTLEASFASAHTVLVSSATLDFKGAVTGTGIDAISGASTLEFGSTLAAAQTIDYSGKGGTLKLTDLTDPLLGYAGSHIKDFKKTDTVDLAGDWIFHRFRENAGVGTLTLENVTSHADLSLKFAGPFTRSDFIITPGTTTTTITHT